MSLPLRLFGYLCRTRLFAAFLVMLAAVPQLGCSACLELARQAVGDPDTTYTALKLEELHQLETELEVVHHPQRVKAVRGGRSGTPYTWLHSTTVRPLGSSVTIEEFGAFVHHEGRWWFSTFTGKPFTALDFAEWYACPDAVVVGPVGCTDHQNWGGGHDLSRGSTVWYFIGRNAEGRRVKGEALVETLPELLKSVSPVERTEGRALAPESE